MACLTASGAAAGGTAVRASADIRATAPGMGAGGTPPTGVPPEPPGVGVVEGGGGGGGTPVPPLVSASAGGAAIAVSESTARPNHASPVFPYPPQRARK